MGPANLFQVFFNRKAAGKVHAIKLEILPECQAWNAGYGGHSLERLKQRKGNKKTRESFRKCARFNTNHCSEVRCLALSKLAQCAPSVP